MTTAFGYGDPATWNGVKNPHENAQPEGVAIELYGGGTVWLDVDNDELRFGDGHSLAVVDVVHIVRNLMKLDRVQPSELGLG